MRLTIASPAGRSLAFAAWYTAWGAPVTSAATAAATISECESGRFGPQAVVRGPAAFDAGGGAGRDVGREVHHGFVSVDGVPNRLVVEQIDGDRVGAEVAQIVGLAPGSGTALTSWPASMSSGATRVPSTPVAPVRKTRLRSVPP